MICQPNIVLKSFSEGDLFEDGLALKNGFFRTRRFAKQGSEAGSLDLFSEGGVGECEVEGVEGEELSSQAEARRRKERLEREEFMIKCRVRNDPHTLFTHLIVCVHNLTCV